MKAAYKISHSMQTTNRLCVFQNKESGPSKGSVMKSKPSQNVESYPLVYRTDEGSIQFDLTSHPLYNKVHYKMLLLIRNVLRKICSLSLSLVTSQRVKTMIVHNPFCSPLR